MSSTRRSKRFAAGFSLLEVMISLLILAVGLLALAALISKADSSTGRSRYMSTAGLLATEKLEELNRLPADDPAIKIPVGTSVGSLTANVGPVTVDGSRLSYFDNVYLSSGNSGQISVTTTKSDATGYLTQIQTPDAGTKAGTTAATPPAPTSDMLNFQRRWLIESDIPGLPPGVRRVTVVVTLVNGSALPPVNFQMSAVRQ